MSFPASWGALLPPEIVTLAETLAARAAAERAAGFTVYPPQERLFAALHLTPPERVRVVLVGQDPYHGAGQANGLAFSVAPGVNLPPSLRNIYKELTEDLGGCPASGDLSSWAEQGVLLLNTSLTVREGQPGSHAPWGWHRVTGGVFAAAQALPQPVVFLLWGRHAQAFHPRAGAEGNKLYLLSSHPSPLGATKPCGDTPPFRGSRPFSAANAWLAANGVEQIVFCP